MSCWEHSREEALAVAKGLLKAHKAVQAEGVASDLCLNPPATKLINMTRWCAEDDAGLALEALLQTIFRIFRGRLTIWREHCYAFETKCTEIQRCRRNGT